MQLNHWPGMESFVPSRKKLYNKELPQMVAEFSNWSENKNFEVMVVVPSSQNDALPFAEAIKIKQPGIQDLSSSFHKKEGFKAGLNTNGSLTESQIWANPFSLKDSKAVVIVDDILSTGSSIVRILEILFDQGMAPNTRVYCAIPLLLMETK